MMKYPMGIKISPPNNEIDYKNRGMNLEKDINATNRYYEENSIAFVYKKPTPIKIIKVDYPSRNKAVIKEAYFEMPSTTDYNGLYKGKYIDFDAKETTSKTSFPLSNIHRHQIKHLENITNNNGIAFLIIRFTMLGLTYYLKGEDLMEIIKNKRKSIPLQYFKEHAYLISNSFVPLVNYIEIIDRIYGGKL